MIYRGPVKKCVKRSGSFPPGILFDALAVDEGSSREDFLYEVGRIQASESLLGYQQHLPDHRGGVVYFLEALGGVGSQPHRGEGGLDRIAGAQVLPVLLGEALEGDHALPSGDPAPPRRW